MLCVLLVVQSSVGISISQAQSLQISVRLAAGWILALVEAVRSAALAVP